MDVPAQSNESEEGEGLGLRPPCPGAAPDWLSIPWGSLHPARHPAPRLLRGAPSRGRGVILSLLGGGEIVLIPCGLLQSQGCPVSWGCSISQGYPVICGTPLAGMPRYPGGSGPCRCLSPAPASLLACRSGPRRGLGGGPGLPR